MHALIQQCSDPDVWIAPVKYVYSCQDDIVSKELYIKTFKQMPITSVNVFP